MFKFGGPLQVDPHLDRFTKDLQQRMTPSQTSTEQPSASLIAAAKRAADKLIAPDDSLDLPPPGSADKVNAALARCFTEFQCSAQPGLVAKHG